MIGDEHVPPLAFMHILLASLRLGGREKVTCVSLNALLTCMLEENEKNADVFTAF